MNGYKLQRATCMVPGIGTLASIYYLLTNKEMRATAKKGLMLLPISAALLSLSTVIPIPGPVLLLAGAYLYWSIIALAAGWGILAAMIVITFIVNTSAGKISTPQVYVKPRTQPQPVITYETSQKRPTDTSNDSNETTDTSAESKAELILQDPESLK
ncbi:MAG: DUF456 domain-containing protein [Candidatus Hydrothermarchaeales archaeon]